MIKNLGTCLKNENIGNYLARDVIIYLYVEKLDGQVY